MLWGRHIVRKMLAGRMLANQTLNRSKCPSPTGQRLELKRLYNLEFISAAASDEVRTGTISKSAKSRQFAVH
jgi:hypothetical protein